MKTILLTLVLVLGVAYGQQAKSADINKTSSLHLNLTTEGKQTAKIKVEVQTNGVSSQALKTMSDVLPGSTELPISEVADGDYFVYFSSPDYAAQWQSVTIKGAKGEPSEMNVKLFRKRYVILRYAFNTSGGRDLSGANVKEGRVAVSHWGNLPFFGQDWQVWQRSNGEDMFGETPYLDFHRYCDGFGFAAAPKGVAFGDLKQAPVNAEYNCQSTKAEKGLTLFCRVNADRKEGLGYGKIFVEDVTETPPKDVKRIGYQ